MMPKYKLILKVISAYFPQTLFFKERKERKKRERERKREGMGEEEETFLR